MARRIIHQLVDDMDGQLLDSNNGETLRFALDGKNYEIDLSAENAARLREALSSYVAAGRRVSGTSVVRSQGRRAELDEIRTWAREQGHTVSDRGRIPRELELAYTNR